ncbi:MAG: DnaA N-terminal domain-containing protein [Steroidobacteraceae bacterium]
MSDRGRKRSRLVRVDLADVRRGLDPPSSGDRDDWERIRQLVRDRLGEDMFEIWLGPLALIAVDASVLVIAAPPEIASWVRHRYGRLLSDTAEQTARELRFAEEPERLAFGIKQERSAGDGPALDIRQQEVM